MCEITAKGVLYGIEMEFVIKKDSEKFKIISNDKDWENIISDEFNSKVKVSHPIGGTYYPETDTMLNAYLTLQDDFFDDDKYKIDVVGEIETIPHEEGVIY